MDNPSWLSCLGKWVEWIWFGLIPAVAPYIFFYIWKPESVKNYFKNKEESE
jgi:hypothetical protein